MSLTAWRDKANNNCSCSNKFKYVSQVLVCGMMSLYCFIAQQALKRAAVASADKDAIDALSQSSREHTNALSTAARDIALLSASMEDLHLCAAVLANLKVEAFCAASCVSAGAWIRKQILRNYETV